MSRYYFDTDDGDTFFLDDEGVDLPDARAARDVAMASFPEMARDKLPNGDHRTFVVHVRDDTGVIIYSAKLELHGEWHILQPNPQRNAD